MFPLHDVQVDNDPEHSLQLESQDVHYYPVARYPEGQEDKQES